MSGKIITRIRDRQQQAAARSMNQRFQSAQWVTVDPADYSPAVYWMDRISNWLAKWRRA